MDLRYNPFNDKETLNTQYGIINFKHAIGRTYVTHRRPEHFFKKKQAFCISISELEICLQNNVEWIMIIYTNKSEEQMPYRLKMSHVRHLEQYNNNNDIQAVFPVKIMETMVGGKWQ